MDLKHCRKANNLSRIGINSTDYGYLCEVWADDLKFISASAQSADVAVRKALRLVSNQRRELAKATQS